MKLLPVLLLLKNWSWILTDLINIQSDGLDDQACLSGYGVNFLILNFRLNDLGEETRYMFFYVIGNCGNLMF
jgi:hypothetical protein